MIVAERVFKFRNGKVDYERMTPISEKEAEVIENEKINI